MGDFFKKILWATDFSDEAQDSLYYADIFAKTFKAKLFALHVVPDFSPALYTAPSMKEQIEKRVNSVKKEATKKLETLKKSKGISFDILTKKGNASKKIIEAIEENDIDLVVMGKKGMSALEKIFIGSVANHVLRAVPCPILLTKKKTGKPKFKKFLVPTDFTEQEEVERNYAWKLAKEFDGDLTFLHVLELHDYEFSPRVLDEMFDSLMKKLKQRRKSEKEDIKISEEITRAINASLGIVDYAETNKYDLIIISTYVHSRLEKFFLGSTTEKVISHSNIPIFAIPPAAGSD